MSYDKAFDPTFQHIFVHKFGQNPSVSAGAGEDVWDGGGLYAFPAAAATTVVYSNLPDDEVTGAQSVQIEGLDADFKEAKEIVVLTGTVTSTATTQFIRTHRMFVVSAGASGTNIGEISCKVGTDETARIGSANGQTLMAIYTIPKLEDRDRAYILGWSAYLPTVAGQNAATVRWQLRPVGGAWTTKDIISMDETNRLHSVTYPWPLDTAEKCDLRVTVDAVSAAATVVGATFDVLYTNQYADLR